VNATELHLARMARAAEAAREVGLAGLLVTPGPDYRYLAGYEPPELERLTVLIVRPGLDPLMIVPELERPLAAASPVGGEVEIQGWRDGEEPYGLAAAALGRTGRYAVADRMRAAQLLGLQGAMAGSEFSPTSTVLSALRAVKDGPEIELLARAGAAADDACRRIVEEPFVGHTEREVAARLGELLVECGHDRAGFAIVGTGPNAASPHHEPGGRRIAEGDVLVMDFGGPLEGYFSDTARTVCVGEPSERAREVHEIVRGAQEAAFRAVAPGVPAQEVDRAARAVISDAGFGERFVHRTGHGIGLEAHEEPYIVEGNAQLLEAGMCFSIEPGIYLPGELGVRIEDIVIVTGVGARRLNDSPRELTSVR